jgi:hypothetical protein
MSLSARMFQVSTTYVKILQKICRIANADIVEFDELSHPVSLLVCGHHFNDAEENWQAVNVRTLIDDMIQRMKDLGLS